MRYVLAAMLLVWAAPGLAQDVDDRTFLAGLIEDAVSGLGREVRLIGFEGALSSRATVEAITIADDDGVWLRLEEVALEWNRAALFSGEIDIDVLQAGRIELSRMPVAAKTGMDLADAEATPFALPDLPVSVQVTDINAAEIDIAPAILGEPLRAAFSGNVSLANGEGEAALRLERIDGSQGRFVIDTSFDNETRQLALALLAEEEAGGLAARTLGLPGSPSVQLDIAGDAPVDDFSALLTLATDGEPRVSGRFALQQTPTETGLLDRRFALDIGGDVRPLLQQEYRSFFGPSAQVALTGTAFGDGRLELEALDISAQQFDISGTATLGKDKWPERFELSGQIRSDTGAPVLLPLAGEETRVSSMALDLAYDAAEGDGWAGQFNLNGVSRPDLEINAITLTGLGTIAPGNGVETGRFDADLLYAATGVGIDDPALADALGEAASGRIRFSRVESAPFQLETFTLVGPGIELDASAEIEGPDSRFQTRFQAEANANDFARFSGLAGREIGGGGTITTSGVAQPFDGIFDLAISATSRDLSVGISDVDPLLAGQTDLTFDIVRDETGTKLTDIALTGDAMLANGEASLSASIAAAQFDAELLDLGLVSPQLSGAARLNADVFTQTDGQIVLKAQLAAQALDATIDARAAPADTGYGLSGALDLNASDLGRYANLVSQRIAGAVTLRAEGSVDTATGIADADLSATTRNLRVGPTGLDPILAGDGQISANLSRNARGHLQLNALSARLPNFTAQGDLALTASGKAEADLELRLADIGVLTPDFSGPLQADIRAEQDSTGWQLRAEATGPAGTRADATGRVLNDGALALSVNGSVPLGLANVYIAPRQLSGVANFDLGVNGPPALRSVDGPVVISAARLTAPNLGQAIENLGGTVTLGGATARFDLAGRFPNGGDVTLTGPVDLISPFQAGLTATIRGAVLREPALYETRANGTIQISGPLAGGATIAGVIDLGETNVQVPSSSVSALGELPEVTHLGARSDVRHTLERAGLGVASSADTQAGASNARPYPLDLTINSPSRIFVRGRGLDAELGGALQLSGTTAQIIPTGRFDLIRGRLDILGQQFDLDEGYAQLQGDFTPFLRLVAQTESGSGTTISIIVEGPADSPEVRFESTPELPQDEVLSQLLFGQSLENISPFQAVQLASAIATLSGRGGGVLDNLREGLDLDDFNVTTDDNGNAAVTAGKYLSENVYTDVTIGSDGTSEINLNLDLSDDVTARGSFGADGETSVGVFFERDY